MYIGIGTWWIGDNKIIVTKLYLPGAMIKKVPFVEYGRLQ
jgi:hypothetical protein